MEFFKRESSLSRSISPHDNRRKKSNSISKRLYQEPNEKSVKKNEFYSEYPRVKLDPRIKTEITEEKCDSNRVKIENKRILPSKHTVSPAGQEEPSNRTSTDVSRTNRGRDSHEASNERRPKSLEKPNFEPSGLLLEETNLKNGVTLKYSEPIDAKFPNDRWRLYVFKGENDKELKTLYLHRNSCFLIGKEPRVSEILLVHPSVSKQHAALQFRHKSDKPNVILPYLIDLESTNGTKLNGEKLEPRRYYELRHGDVLKFGQSSRELILVQESKAENVKKLSYAEYVEEAIKSGNIPK